MRRLAQGTTRGARGPGTRPARWLACAALASLLCACGSEEHRSRGLSDYEFRDAASVLYGNRHLGRRPAVVNSSRVYAAIAEYRQILDEGLRDDVPKYHVLLKRASERFLKALRAAASAAGHDVVAEVGTVRLLRAGVAEPPDLTEATIARLN